MKPTRLLSRLVIAADDKEKDKGKKEGKKDDKKKSPPPSGKPSESKDKKDDKGDKEGKDGKDKEAKRDTDVAKDPHENTGPVDGHNEKLAPMGVIKTAFACMQLATKAKAMKLKMVGRSEVFSYPSSVNSRVFLEHFSKIFQGEMEKEFKRSPNMMVEVNVYHKVFVLPSKGKLNVVEGCYDGNHIFMIMFVPGGVIFSYDERAES